jgi:hypothetical protein
LENYMLKPMTWAVLAVAGPWLAGCDKSRIDPPVPRVDAGKSTVAETSAAPRRDPSVPSADSVLTAPATATAKDETGTRPTSTLTRAQESSAMPMAGQANNHSSTALDSPKGASAP